jgi:hypothetical protein
VDGGLFPVGSVLVMENVGKALWKFRTKPELAAGLVEWCFADLRLTS